MAHGRSCINSPVKHILTKPWAIWQALSRDLGVGGEISIEIKIDTVLFV